MASTPAPGYPAPGARIGRFRILEQLGQGGMGVVFRAMEENLGREVALKVIAPLYAHDPEFRERFTREARSQASLESAHVVAVYAHGEEDGYLYIASQLIVDGDLGELIRSAGVPPMVNALEVIEQVASGLSDAHTAGLVHRDIKPGNVLVRIRGGAVRAYLCDFGISRRMNAEATRFSSSTVGTPSYMAPELHGGAMASVATDIYSLGCLLWVALTGTMPYQAATEYQLIGAHLTHPVPQLPGAGPMEHAANRILRTAMAKDPTDRYRSVAGMRADLQAALRLPATPGPAVLESDRSGPTAVRLHPDLSGHGAGSGTRGRTPGGSTDRPFTVAPAARPAAWRPPGSGGSGAPSPGSGSSGPPNAGSAGPSGSGPTPPPPAWSNGGGSAGASRGGRRWWVIGGVAATLAIGAGVLAAVLTGAGGGGSPEPDDGLTAAQRAFLAGDPKDIVTASEKEMSVLEYAHVSGQFQSDDGIIGVDMVATSIGDCEGTMTPAVGSAEFRLVDGTAYLRPDAAYWRDLSPATADQVIGAVGDKWVENKGLRKSLRPVCDLDRFLERDGREDADATLDGTQDVDGELAAQVTQSEGADSETIYVRLDDPHYMVRLEESSLDYFDFSDFDTEVDIAAPGADQIFDLDQYVADHS